MKLGKAFFGKLRSISNSCSKWIVQLLMISRSPTGEMSLVNYTGGHPVECCECLCSSASRRRAVSFAPLVGLFYDMWPIRVGHAPNMYPTLFWIRLSSGVASVSFYNSLLRILTSARLRIHGSSSQVLPHPLRHHGFTQREFVGLDI